MVRRLDLARWKRRDHFLFFREFEQPFFNVCIEFDVSRLTAATAAAGRSFFLATLYATLRAANDEQALRLRIRDGEVVEHERVDGGTTVLRDDETFGFGYFDYQPSFEAFEAAGRQVLETVRSRRTLDDQPARDDLIYYSVLPWINFSSFSHARRCPSRDSNPRMVFGKRSESGDAVALPFSIEVHHALVDGLGVGRFLAAVQQLFDAPEETLEL